jgi:NhaA family Na+:H+ antiporter
VDDIIAVLVIAIFYSGQIYPKWLVAAIAGIAVVVIMNRVGVRTVVGYLVVGCGIWLFTLKSGIHPTISGVVLGLLTPVLPLVSRDELRQGLDRAMRTIAGERSSAESVKLREVMEEVDLVTREAISPLERLEADIHPWAAFVIMPVFALANAGVPFSVDAVSSPIAIAVALALLVGKPLGIVLSLILLVKARLGILPGGTHWGAALGAGCLAGIGFTMSLFVASLGLEGDLLVDAKTGILLGSALSGAIGYAVLALSLRRRPVVADGLT